MRKIPSQEYTWMSAFSARGRIDGLIVRRRSFAQLHGLKRVIFFFLERFMCFFDSIPSPIETDLKAKGS